MDDEITMPDGYDPELTTELAERLEAEGYELVDTDGGKAYRHPDTGHTIYLSETNIPGEQYEPGDDVEM